MIISIIPARSGSKGIPKKNIKLLGGYPLIAYSIVASKLCTQIERTIVSTDSKEIADISLSYGAEVPFLRPKKISSDMSPDIEYIRHAIKWFEIHEKNPPEFIVQLRPTTPLRDPEIIDTAVKKLIKNKNATSLRSAHETPESPYKFFTIEDDFFKGMFPNDPRPEYFNLPRQMFPPAYHPNGYTDIVKSETVMKGSLYGSKILSFITPVVSELDRIEDFEYVEFTLNKQKNKIFDYLKKISQGGKRS